MKLKQEFPEQYEILKEVFDPQEIETKCSRLNSIYRDCESAWEKNLDRLKNIKIKYLLIGEAAPWTQEDGIRYFYKTFDSGKDKRGNDKPVNWIRGVWNAFYDDSPPEDVDSSLNMLANKQFLLVDSLPFAMQYTAKIRNTESYAKLVSSCCEYLSSKINKIRLSNDVKIAIAFKLNGERIIDACSQKIKLPSGQVLNSKMIAATGSGFPTCSSLKKIWHIRIKG